MFLVLQACTHFLHLLLSIHHSRFGFSLLCAAQLGSGLIPLMILDGSSLADAPRYVPAGWWDDWCEAGTRRGHYNWGGLQAGGMAGARTTTDVDYRQVDCWCCFLWGRTLHGAIVAYGHRPGGHISTNKQRTSTEWRYASLSKGFFG